MSIEHIDFNQENEGSPFSKGRSRAIVWNYFEKIIGDDGLPKTRCTRCKKVYSTTPNSGTSTMRRHLPKCIPQPLNQVRPAEACAWAKTATCSDEPSNEVRAVKKLKSVVEDNLQTKTDRELMEFIWRTKRNIPLLEEKLPDKAIAIKEALKCYEDELDRRAKLRLHKESSPGCGTNIETVKIEMNDQPLVLYGNFGENMAVAGRDVEDEAIKAQTDVNQVEMDDPSVAGDENSDGNIAEDESAGRLRIGERHGDENQTSGQESALSLLPEDICAELRKVSSMLSMLTSPHSFYTPQDNPLDEEAEQAKKALIELLKKDLETIVGSPDEQNVKSCIRILTKNLDKLPRFQGRVVESLRSEFETACRNWATWRMNVHANIEFEVQQGDNLEVLQEWQEKDMEVDSSIAKVDADIVRLKAKLREKELTRESLVKQKSLLFDQSKISIDEAKKLLEEMVSMKLQSDVALDNMKDLVAKWERMRENFQVQ